MQSAEVKCRLAWGAVMRLRTFVGYLVVAVHLTSGSQGATVPSGWQTYFDPKLRASISYPPGWKLNRDYVSVSLGPDHTIKGIAVIIPDILARGTNLASDFTEVAVESIPGANCTPLQFLNPAEAIHKLKADGRVYSAASSSDSGAGENYDTFLFVVDGTSPCIAVRYFIHYSNVENFDPGTVKAFDRSKLLKLFDDVRATLKLSP